MQEEDRPAFLGPSLGFVVTSCPTVPSCQFPKSQRMPGPTVRGPKTRVGVFDRCRRTSARRTPGKSLNSRRVARLAAVETASSVRPHPGSLPVAPDLFSADLPRRQLNPDTTTIKNRHRIVAGDN